jgi:hypothetical protein
MIPSCCVVCASVCECECVVKFCFQRVACYFLHHQDPIVGIQLETAAILDVSEPDWRVNGVRGVLQCYFASDQRIQTKISILE